MAGLEIASYHGLRINSQAIISRPNGTETKQTGNLFPDDLRQKNLALLPGNCTFAAILEKESAMKNELETPEQLEAHVTEETAGMLYFYNDHCAPCLSLRPKIIEMVEEDFPNIKLAFVNSEKHPELPALYNVFSNPTLIVFFDGREYRRVSKYISVPQLAAEIERPYQMIFEN